MKKMRINMILGKKHLIVAGLALVLAVGLYANFAISNDVKSTETGTNNYGETTFVSGGSNNDSEADDDAIVTDTKTDISDKMQSVSDEYFAQARIDKKNSRAEAAEVLKSMYAGGDLTKDEMEVVAQDAVKMTDLMESETKIETMLKAQGFEDALCYLSGKSANIIVKTSGLDNAQAAQIKNALLGEVDVSADNITIVEVN